ncbi:Acetylornithine deacetylase/Succinyl-diaminopimelate desuccinylase [Amycolatopsis arida]|uniref:Acetylornithine deacetylase/Succinyl-diaminopimelate desuccinylase n=1 Tax=Amycolatopsis arida TaxID=587909 RepID=A0A1I5TF91_9PSEU|nr:M20/M25/M40 family metallo-hydrolase [Amycolatopsis arida]TDX96117.1 acetylornithine deacetylase/succinyl-diaminopimelate desuccinylase-like protein [Amycolatopsis arida]SFP81725.1 Acetylornithine deacetylase/Succinyl-diaminopimelate desuccinylase [Amycolatopsis arida]
MDQRAVRETVRHLWAGDALRSLSHFVAIPALSPAFDVRWATTRHLHDAVTHVRTWLDERPLPGATTEVVELPGRTPLLLLDVPAAGTTGAETVVVYGHLDKQPAAGEWSPGLGPWTPVVRDGRLYGRGAGDDGYAGYAAATALAALHAAGGRHARTVVLLETGEESGSPDLAAYLDHLAERIGPVGLVVCLNTAGGDYDALWLATSLRGIAFLDVTVRVLETGVHSGHASGLVASSFRVLRELLDRIEDPRTGRILLPELATEVPAERLAEVRAAVARGYRPAPLPLVDGVRLVDDDPVQLILNNTWRPTLSVTGADGLPPVADAGNVLRPATTLKLSFRLPPTVDAGAALRAVERALTTDVPFDADVRIARPEAADGWNAPPMAPWLRSALDTVGADVFGRPWQAIGLGGSIPFLGLFARAYPDAQFVVTGPRGPGNNAHVPDEWLHLEQTARVTEAVAHLLHAHATAPG